MLAETCTFLRIFAHHPAPALHLLCSSPAGLFNILPCLNIGLRIDHIKEITFHLLFLYSNHEADPFETGEGAQHKRMNLGHKVKPYVSGY